ncbi:MAG: hypothetical protein WC179_02830 [Candidatus Cloacimonadaceae bacterium]|nr:hypothetical protein [Candidatus Cloacimonadota bacterium]MDY0112121.1 hypothetical protein [Candidatus Syntrophosphaera sp.]
MKFFWLLQSLIFHYVIPYVTLICPTIFSKVSPAYLCPTYVQLMSSLCPAYVRNWTLLAYLYSINGTSPT